MSGYSGRLEKYQYFWPCELRVLLTANTSPKCRKSKAKLLPLCFPRLNSGDLRALNSPAQPGSPLTAEAMPAYPGIFSLDTTAVQGPQCHCFPQPAGCRVRLSRAPAWRWDPTATLPASCSRGGGFGNGRAVGHSPGCCCQHPTYRW